MTSEVRQFPILMDYWERKEFPEVPSSMPWAILEPHRATAERNHSQTLERLAERGGLCPIEMWLVLNGKDLHHFKEIDMNGAVEFLMSRIFQGPKVAE